MNLFLVNEVVFDNGVSVVLFIVHDLYLNSVDLLLTDIKDELNIIEFVEQINIKDNEEAVGTASEFVKSYVRYLRLVEAQNAKKSKLTKDFILNKTINGNAGKSVVDLDYENNKLIYHLFKNSFFGFIKINNNAIEKYIATAKKINEINKQILTASEELYVSLAAADQCIDYYEGQKNELLDKIRKWNSEQYLKAKEKLVSE